MPQTAENPTVFAPLIAATGNPLQLDMQRLWLTGNILPAGARLLVQHVFQSSEKKPVEVIYSFGLPRDAALRRFTIEGEGFTVHSELKPTAEAIKTYEAGLEAGSLSTLARQYGDGIVNLSAGNILPQETVTVTLEILAGVESRDDGYRFRFPFTLAPGYHSRARMLETEPGTGEIELPSDDFGDLILPRFAKDASALHAVGFDLHLDGALSGISSPSHSIGMHVEENGARVTLSKARDLPNRDLVLDARLRAVATEVYAGSGQFIAIIPSSSFGENPNTTRRVVFVLDRSGSMQGEPINQARKAIEACLGALSPGDEFGLIAFDDRTEVFLPALAPATKENRLLARSYLQTIDARGSTELVSAIDKAAQLAAGAADVLILTDGQVLGTEQILARARAAGLRLHTFGIGSASQDRFLSLLARETGGVSRFVTPQERVDLAAVDLFASIGRPVATNIQVTGARVQPDPPPAVFANMPWIAYGEADAGASLHLQWPGGELHLPIPAGTAASGETVRLLRGARLITDFESRYDRSHTAEKREADRIADRLRTLSETYSLASREMSLVAVVQRTSDKPGEVPITKVVPVGIPQDVKFTSYFGGSAMPMSAPPLMMSARAHVMPRASIVKNTVNIREAFLPRLTDAVDETALFGRMPAPDVLQTGADRLLALAASIEDDGGMPGDSADDRVRRTVVAVLGFLSEGHSAKAGAFRSHVQRLVGFLESSRSARPAIARVVELARIGTPVDGQWFDSKATWEQIEAALQ